MATFPKSEAETLVLANEIKTGLANNTTVYPTPPVTTTAIETLILTLQTAQNAVIEARAIAEQATISKLAALENLAKAMKREIRYAEGTVNYDDAKLKLIGWGARKPSVPLSAPGQVVELIVVEQGEGWLAMQWKKPTDGGTVGFYKLHRRARPDGPWVTIESPTENYITISSQERGTEWEFRVSAVNKAGEGLASNIVLAVL